MKHISASPTPSEHRLICLVCHKQFSQYTCPRCNIRYCSLPCYKSHSVRCVESFNRDNVMGEMQNLGATPETRQRMMETLKRFHSDSDGGRDNLMEGDDAMDLNDEEEIESRSSVLSEKTLDKIAAGEQIELDDLTPEEKKAFLRAVASGEFSHMIKPWEPWWLNPFAKTISLSQQGNRLVQPVDAKDYSQSKDESAKDVFDVPAPLESPLPSLKQLTSVQPSPLLGVHLVEVLYSYCFTLRLYNGDWLSDVLDAALTCLSVSQVLGQAASPESISEALGNCLQTICSPIFKSAGGYRFAVALLDDAAALLHLGRPGVICSLADSHRLFDAAMKELKQEGKPGTLKKASFEPKGEQSVKHSQQIQSRGAVTRLRTGGAKAFSNPGKADLRKFLGASKKVYFLLCWANEQSDDVFSSLALLIEGEKARLFESDMQTSQELQTKTGKDVHNRKHLIEEIS